ncbi:hypothetical protein CKAH01_05952 [Colletotrichum kahawae]|uniref:Uncharacterized protein n=1 Tax=Colletotrichum kahawae TaxID=34407 RepID=A0AAD9YC32_COLKA|nr:hypothetical protein CKAH01_05952 [Colletotrichum kahawae]
MEASPRRSNSTPLYTQPLPSVHLSPVHAKANYALKHRHENSTRVPIRAIDDHEQSPRRLPAAEETSRPSQDDDAFPLQPVDVERVRTIEKVAAAKIYLENY